MTAPEEPEARAGGDLAALYQAVIVEHDRAPRHEGPLAGSTHEATLDNPLCGDVVTMRVRVSDDDTVTAAAFEGRGCALSRAAADLLADAIVGRAAVELPALVARFDAFVRAAPATPAPAPAQTTTADDHVALGPLTAFAGVRAFRSRQACATLPFRALTAALARR